MAQPRNPINSPGGGGFNPPNQGTTRSSPVSFGLLTSSGGVSGAAGLMMAPYVNPVTGRGYVIIFDSTNFDCEESAEYDYPQVIPPEGQGAQEGRDVSCHLIILKYREIGVANFFVNVTVYHKLTDIFETKSIPVSVPYVPGRTFPDKRIHTKFLGLKPAITGERPQVTITRIPNGGPFSVTSLTLCGNADETPQF